MPREVMDREGAMRHKRGTIPEILADGEEEEERERKREGERTVERRGESEARETER